MLKEIYKSITANVFTSKGQDKENNKRLGIKRTFSDDAGRYIQVYRETWGYSVILWGDGFMNRFYACVFDVEDKKDAQDLKEFMAERINNSQCCKSLPSDIEVGKVMSGLSKIADKEAER